MPSCLLLVLRTGLTLVTDETIFQDEMNVFCDYRCLAPAALRSDVQLASSKVTAPRLLVLTLLSQKVAVAHEGKHDFRTTFECLNLIFALAPRMPAPSLPRCLCACAVPAAAAAAVVGAGGDSGGEHNLPRHAAPRDGGRHDPLMLQTGLAQLAQQGVCRLTTRAPAAH